MPTDTINLRGLRVLGRHGANPGEKDVLQPFDIDLSLELDLAAARSSDALEDTVNYAALQAAVVEIVATTSFDLLERLGEVILECIFADARIERAHVTIAKPRLLAGATPSVTLRKVRS